MIAFDLGAHLGWAILAPCGKISSGTKKFKHKEKYARYVDYYHFIRGIIQTLPPAGMIAYELVRRHAGTQAAHAYGAYEGILHMASCGRTLVPYPVGTIKRHATGVGNASKSDMINAALMRGHTPCDDNEADALAILYLAMDADDGRPKG
jgi:Holliday junction resolvasome RuvABC endonuclease subunit